jgi:hypothetical protein
MEEEIGRIKDKKSDYRVGKIDSRALQGPIRLPVDKKELLGVVESTYKGWFNIFKETTFWLGRYTFNSIDEGGDHRLQNLPILLKPGKATGQQLGSRVCQQVVFSDSSGAGSPGPGLLPLHAILSLSLVILAVMENFLAWRMMMVLMLETL